ncbi:MAG: hypothetical protein ACYC9O_13045 [Candidatus Latescibacterota bacterium]
MAGEKGLLKLPVLLVVFDRHRDSLAPGESRALLNRFRNGGSFPELADLVSLRLSPRDDDWLLSGMEAGLISDTVRFGTEPDGMEKITRYRDLRGGMHRVFHLERPSTELSYKGALADSDHPAVSEGLWETLGWNPETRSIRPRRGGMHLDIDLDFFTISWETHTLPFPEEVYEKEFLLPRQSLFFDDYLPASFLNSLLDASGAVTIASEPVFCGGREKARRILEDVNRFLLGGILDTGSVSVDYVPPYPDS